MKHKYVCIDGIDGGGKSTLVRHVFDELCRRGVCSSPRSFPSSGHIGRAIREALRGKLQLPREALLYLYVCDGVVNDSDMRWFLHHGHCHLIADRHPTLPSLVYQTEIHSERHILDVIASTNLLEPDVLFILDVPPHVSRERLLRRSQLDCLFENAELEKLAVIRHRYLELADRMGAHILDGTRPINELRDDVIQIAELG